MRQHHYHEELRSAAAVRKAQATKRQPTERELAYKAALTAYTAARKEAQANGTKLPSMAQFMPVFN